MQEGGESTLVFSVLCHTSTPAVNRPHHVSPNHDAVYALRAIHPWLFCSFLTSIQMEAFRECWKRQGNDQRTQTKDA